MVPILRSAPQISLLPMNKGDTAMRSYMREMAFATLVALGVASIPLVVHADAATGAGSAPVHFDPQGKPPSTFTLEIRDRLKAELPFSDKRDFDEAK